MQTRTDVRTRSANGCRVVNSIITGARLYAQPARSTQGAIDLQGKRNRRALRWTSTLKKHCAAFAPSSSAVERSNLSFTV